MRMWLSLWIVAAVIIGWAFGMYTHPYEVCERKGVSPDDIAECVWLLENQPALR